MALDDKNGFEVSADTWFGRIAAKGVRVSDLIALLTLLGVVSALYLVWMSLQVLSSHEHQANAVNQEIAASIKEAGRAQRMMTCVISLSQEKREQEFMQQNSFCKQISMMP